MIPNLFRHVHLQLLYNIGDDVRMRQHDAFGQSRRATGIRKYQYVITGADADVFRKFLPIILQQGGKWRVAICFPQHYLSLQTQ